MLPQAGDCETIRSGLLARPISALTAVGFIAAGLCLAGRHQDRDARIYGWGLGAVGLASLLFHASATT
jgi:hypothetical protein